MSRADNHDERIRNMTFGSVYPHYVAEIEKKGRTKAELHQVIAWLTGYSDIDILRHIKEKSTFETFFAKATLNPNARLITGTIYSYRVEAIENPLTQQARYKDLIDIQVWR